MAKSVRASVSKRNRAKLRATVFGPVVDARTERLAAKLQELASYPKEQGKINMELDATGTDERNESTGPKIQQSEDMDIDRGASKATKSHSHQSGRIQKRNRKKSRSSIVFHQRQSKAKKAPRKK